MPEPRDTTPEWIAGLANPNPQAREKAARELFRLGCADADPVFSTWFADPEFRALARPGNTLLTVGVAVEPARFAAIRSACGAPRLADVPARSGRARIYRSVSARRAAGRSDRPRCRRSWPRSHAFCLASARAFSRLNATFATCRAPPRFFNLASRLPPSTMKREPGPTAPASTFSWFPRAPHLLARNARS